MESVKNTAPLKESDYRPLAEQSVIQRGSEWAIQFKRPIEGVDLDTQTTYRTRELAVEAAFNALKTAHAQAAAA